MDDILEHEYNEPMDISSFCSGLEKAWKCIPGESFATLIELVFNGYNLYELNTDEMVEMLDDFILQNS